MSEDRAVPEGANPEVESYEPPEVSDFGSLVELTLSGSSALTDVAGFSSASATGGGS
jgi:hypothetical protein